MNTWDFSIQKEDEQNWSFLGSLDQFKAGKYYLIAHTSRVHQNIDICIAYYPESDPTTRQNQQYSRRTNGEGLLSIFSSMQLYSGIWKISCYPDIMEQLCGENWKQKITLKVCLNSEIKQQESLDILTESILLKSHSFEEENQIKKLEQNLIEIELNPENQQADLVNLVKTRSEKVDLDVFLDGFINHSEENQKQDILEKRISFNSEEDCLITTKFRQTNHVIQLYDLDCNSSIIFDIEMLEPEKPFSKSLDLPNPTRMNKYLYKKYLGHPQILPPKLSSHRLANKPNKSIQLAKFEPYSIKL